MVNNKVCDLNEMPEVIAREPNGAGVGREDVLQRALKSMEIRLSELSHSDKESLWLMLTEPHLSYAEGVSKLRSVVETIQPVCTGVD